MLESFEVGKKTPYSLLVIDNEPLKKEAAERAQIWLEKIEDFELALKKFNDVDQPLFAEWYNLTTHPLREEVEALTEEYSKLIEFHNTMIFILNDQDVSMAQAYLILKEEDDRYQRGDAKVRADIDKVRALRKTLIEHESGPEENFERARDSADEDTGRSQKVRDDEDDRIRFFEKLTDREASEILRDPEDGASFLMNAVAILMQHSRGDLLKKFWKLAPWELKKNLNKMARKNLGHSLEELFEERAGGFKDFESDFQDPQAEEALKSSKAKPTSRKETTAEEQQLKLKALYRKIVRKIHPDQFTEEVTPEIKSWLGGLWHKVVQYYQKEDAQALEVLHHKIILRLRKYEELSVSEIGAAARSLEKELQELLREQKNTRQGPAWNFSELKSYKKVENQVSKPFRLEKKRILENIEELELEHEILERQSRHFAEHHRKK